MHLPALVPQRPVAVSQSTLGNLLLVQLGVHILSHLGIAQNPNPIEPSGSQELSGCLVLGCGILNMTSFLDWSNRLVPPLRTNPKYLTSSLQICAFFFKTH